MILDGRVVHQGPLPGDSGIQFEADPKAPGSIVALLMACQRSPGAAREPNDPGAAAVTARNGSSDRG